MGMCEMTYAACGTALDSDVYLPELGQARRRDPAYSFHLLPACAAPAAPTTWIFERWLANGQTSLSIAKRNATDTGKNGNGGEPPSLDLSDLSPAVCE